MVVDAGDPDQQPVPGAADRGGHQRQPHHQRLQQAQRAVPPLLVIYTTTARDPYPLSFHDAVITSLVRIVRCSLLLVRRSLLIHLEVGLW